MAKKFDKEAWLEGKQQKLEGARAALDEGLRKLQSSDDWQQVLRAMAHAGALSITRLSFGNILLVLSSRPAAQRVATFQAWLRMGRHVRKGEKAVHILAPVFRRRTEDADSSSSAGSEEEPAKRLAGFRLLPVFTEEQTEGDPLPSFTLPDIAGDEAFASSLEKLRAVAATLPEVQGLELRERAPGDHPDANGWYVPATQRIVVITSGRSRAQQFRTLCHELAHALLHPLGDPHSRPEREVEAESTAFVVCHALGIDSGTYSFPYVAGWAAGDDALRLVERSGTRIARAATTLLDALCDAATEVDEAAEAA